MIYLKHLQLSPWITPAEGVQPCAQKHILTNSIGNGNGKIVLCISAASNQERSQRNRKHSIRSPGRLSQIFGISIPENADSIRVFKHQGLCVVQLVRSPSQSDTKRSSRWPCLFHSDQPDLWVHPA